MITDYAFSCHIDLWFNEKQKIISNSQNSISHFDPQCLIWPLTLNKLRWQFLKKVRHDVDQNKMSLYYHIILQRLWFFLNPYWRVPNKSTIIFYSQKKQAITRTNNTIITKLVLNRVRVVKVLWNYCGLLKNGSSVFFFRVNGQI